MDISEVKGRLPKWAKTLLTIVFVVGPTCGAIATITKTYYEVQSAKKSAVQAKVNTEASYETLAPAVQELQAMSEEEQLWANEMSDYTQGLENRIIRLEAYIEVISQRGNMPSPMPIEEAAVVSMAPASKPEPSEQAISKAARPIPQSLDKAKAYQEQRTKEKCPKGDPICGNVGF